MKQDNRYIKAFKRLYKQLDDIQAKYNTPKFILLLNALWCHILYGATPNDYIHFELYKYKHRERKQYITHRRTLWLEKKFNDPINANFFNDKHEFNKKFKDFVKRSWIFIPESNEEDFLNFTKKFKKVLVKPTDLSSGRGISIFKYENEEKTKTYYNSIKGCNLLVEEISENHKDIKEFNSSSTNTIRVYTLVEKDKSVTIVGAVIRIGSKGACVDNYHSGGVAAAIDIDTGVIATKLVDINNNRYILHPTNKAEIIGKHIPNWEELKNNVKKAAMVFPTSRYIGWDICITKDGFEYIEGNYNANPDLLQNCEQKGKYYLLKNKI